jgi:hypothetical protein
LVLLLLLLLPLQLLEAASWAWSKMLGEARLL